jgi:hypothetical protein
MVEMNTMYWKLREKDLTEFDEDWKVLVTERVLIVVG